MQRKMESEKRRKMPIMPKREPLPAMQDVHQFRLSLPSEGIMKNPKTNFELQKKFVMGVARYEVESLKKLIGKTPRMGYLMRECITEIGKGDSGLMDEKLIKAFLGKIIEDKDKLFKDQLEAGKGIQVRKWEKPVQKKFYNIQRSITRCKVILKVFELIDCLENKNVDVYFEKLESALSEKTAVGAEFRINQYWFVAHMKTSQ